MNATKTVTPAEWLQERRELLVAEKAAMQQLDEVSRRRRELPRVRVEKNYLFSTPQGTRSLADLFGDHSQLITYHFMFAPGWQEGCVGCSFVSDHFDGANLHLAHHDVALVAVSRAKLAEFLPFKERMGWRFPWVSSAESDFNYDFGVSFTREQIESGTAMYNFTPTAKLSEELPGLSVFTKDADGSIYHTYSTYTRGLDLLLGTHNLLDLTPHGRNEESTMSWVRHHDRYPAQEVLRISELNLASQEDCQHQACCASKESV